MKKDDLKVAFSYVGAIVGAGFASGQELVKFFAVFNGQGLWGVLLSGIAFAFLGGMVVYLVNKIQVSDYSKLLSLIFPRKIYLIIDYIISISLWTGLGIMLVASSTLLKEQLNFTVFWSFIVTGIIIFFSLSFGNKGFLNTNTVLVPILIFLAVGCSTLYLIKPVFNVIEKIQIKSLLPNWWIASLIYVNYNMVLGIVVLSSVKEKDNKMSPLGGILGGICLALMAWLMVSSLVLLPGEQLLSEIPMLVLAQKVNPLVGKIYSIALWLALFTTALANAHSLTKRIYNKTGFSYYKILLFILLSTFLFIPFKFSILVGIVYPLLGYIGFPLILGIIITFLRIHKK